MTNTALSARETLRQVADVNGWTRHGQDGTWDRDLYVRADVTVNARFGVRGAVASAERVVAGQQVEVTNAHGKRETVASWLAQAAEAPGIAEDPAEIVDVPGTLGDPAEAPSVEQVSAAITDPAWGTEPAADTIARAELTNEEHEDLYDPPTWERNLARLADGPAADRIAELEARLAESRRMIETQAVALDAYREQEDEDAAIVEGLVAAIVRMQQEAGVNAQGYRALREHCTQLEDAPVRSSARRLVETLRDMEGGTVSLSVSRAYGLLADALGMDVTRPAQVPDPEVIQAMMDTAPTVPAILDVLGVPVRRALPGERIVVQETHRESGHPLPRTRVIGSMRDGVLSTDEGRGSIAIPPEQVAAYVTGVRAAGYPAPARRREVAAGLPSTAEAAAGE